MESKGHMHQPHSHFTFTFRLSLLSQVHFRKCPVLVCMNPPQSPLTRVGFKQLLVVKNSNKVSHVTAQYYWVKHSLH